MVQKKILLVTDSYPPEIRSASELMSELALGLADKGYGVTVMTTSPKYNLDPITQKLTYKTVQLEGQIKVVRIKTLPHHNVGYVLRGLAQIIMPFQFLVCFFIHSIKASSVIVYSPPLPLAMFGAWLRIFGIKFILNLQDIFPQNAIDLLILKNKYQIWFFKKLEKYIYKCSDVITVHSQGNRELVLSSHPEIALKVSVLHNWIDFNRGVIKNHSAIDIRLLWGIKHKYIAIFAGVMGPSQNLELVIRVADEAQKNYPNLMFLFIGDGSDRSKIEKLSSELMLSNVVFKDFVDPNLYRQIVKQCSFGIVSLSPDNKTPVVPGKILGYMEAAIPIVGFLHKESDGHQIIQSAQCGVSAISSDLTMCIEYLNKFMKSADNFSKIGNKGYEYAKNNYAKEKILNHLETFF
jgi:colanic acid biosynthesis glycosyl transferase WcaI